MILLGTEHKLFDLIEGSVSLFKLSDCSLFNLINNILLPELGPA